MNKGEIYIISTGPGQAGYLTCNAREALKKSDLIVGYTKYLRDISDLILDKETYATGMTQEVERCKYAIKEALAGRKVAIISNGDANVYGMSGLVLEIIEENKLWDQLEVSIEPGITSLLAAASKTGAPLMTDFAVVSLSNLLVSLDLIEKRIINALQADFVLAIYNPLSNTRKEPYFKFLSIIEDHRKKETPVTIAQNLGRGNEKIMIKNVDFLLTTKDDLDIINMSTVLIIGNSTTKFINNGSQVLTLRGYQQAYDYKL